MKTNIKNHIRNNRRAFTLMEVLLVLGILGVIMAMVVPKVLGRQSTPASTRLRSASADWLRPFACIRWTIMAISQRWPTA